MRRRFQVALPEARIEQFAPRAGAQDPLPLLVCENRRLIGAIGVQDVAARISSPDPGTRRVLLRDIVPCDLLYCLESTELTEAAKLMREGRVEWIPVVALDRHPVGVLMLADLPGELSIREAAADGAREDASSTAPRQRGAAPRP